MNLPEVPGHATKEEIKRLMEAAANVARGPLLRALLEISTYPRSRNDELNAQSMRRIAREAIAKETT